MATYCYRCSVCGEPWVTTHWNLAGEECFACERGAFRRDYRAEGASFNEATLRRTRDGNAAYRDQFLPTMKDFESPSDPDGSKGIRKWNDEHSPHKDASGIPLRPEIKRRSW